MTVSFSFSHSDNSKNTLSKTEYTASKKRYLPLFGYSREETNSSLHSLL